MRRVLFGVFAVIAGLTSGVRADDDAEPFKALAGAWYRQGQNPTRIEDAQHITSVIPRLWFADSDDPALRYFKGLHPAPAVLERKLGKAKSWDMLVGATPIFSYRLVLSEHYVCYNLTTGKEKGELVVSRDGKQTRFTYTLDKDTLTIKCKDLIPAGRSLGHYNITGVWQRAKAT